MQNLKPLVTIAVLLALVGAAVVLSRKAPAPAVSIAVDPAASTTVLTQDSSYKIEYLAIPQDTENTEGTASSSAPLSRQVKYSPGLSPEVKRILSERIAALRGSLSKNVLDFNSWMSLAVQYKTAGDYEGAKEVWEYITLFYPGDSIALHNLGDLYHHFLNDFAKAEYYFKRAIDADSTRAINYAALHELYRYSYKRDTALAADILKEGIEKVSGNQVIDMYSELGSYYQDKNDTGNAILYYTRARDVAEKAGNASLAAQLDAALNELKK